MANMKPMKCIFCNRMEDVDYGAKAVLCSYCVARLVGAPEQAQSKEPKLTKAGVPRKKRGEAVKKVPSGKPVGWHFKRYYKHTDGTVWHRGELVTDPQVVKELEREYA